MLKPPVQSYSNVLKQRVITGVVLVILVLCVILLLPPSLFLMAFAAIICQGAWEWSRLAGLQGSTLRRGYLVVTLLAMAGLYKLPSEQRVVVFYVGSFWWVLAFYLIRRYPALGPHWKHPVPMCITGLLVLLPGWTALVQLSSSPHYVQLILLLFALVAGADIGAYFCGRAFGKHKLAPNVSPNKTWEGFAGGILLSCMIALTALLTAPLDPPPSLRLVLLVSTAAFAVAVFSVVGDLFESMVKRLAGVKDSGSLLPGHGGVLDRIDSITAALPLYVLSLQLVSLP